MATVKTKLEAVSISVEALSGVVRDGNGKGSLITRLALAEKAIEDIEKGFDGLKEEVGKEIQSLRNYLEKEKEDERSEEESERAFKRQKLLARLKVVAVTTPGLLALIIMLIKMLAGEGAP